MWADPIKDPREPEVVRLTTVRRTGVIIQDHTTGLHRDLAPIGAPDHPQA